MLTVDNRQLQYRLDKIQADFRQEADKVRYITQIFCLNFVDVPLFSVKYALGGGGGGGVENLAMGKVMEHEHFLFIFLMHGAEIYNYLRYILIV
jgi:hypothetical protein